MVMKCIIRCWFLFWATMPNLFFSLNAGYYPVCVGKFLQLATSHTFHCFFSVFRQMLRQLTHFNLLTLPFQFKTLKLQISLNTTELFSPTVHFTINNKMSTPTTLCLKPLLLLSILTSSLSHSSYERGYQAKCEDLVKSYAFLLSKYSISHLSHDFPFTPIHLLCSPLSS
jgi:hypothetical protein